MGMLIKTYGAPAASPLPHTYFAGKGTLTRVGLPTPQSKQPVTLLPEKNKAPSVAKTGGAEQSDTTFLQKLNDLVTVNQNMQTANSAMAVGRLFGNKQLESTGKQLGQTAYENYRDAAKEFQYIAERAALGAAKGTEGIVNALGYLGQMQNRAQIQQNAQVLGAWGALTGNSDFKGAAQHMNDYTRELKDAGLQDTVSFGDRYQQNIQHRYADTDITKTGRVLGDVSETLGGLAPAAAMNVAAPGSGIAITALSAGGNAAQEALASGASDHQALAYGIAVGGVEAATEKMFDGVAGVFGKGTADDVVEGIAKRLAKNERAQAALVKVANSLGEGFEEFVSEFTQRAANELLIDTDDRTLWETNRDAAYSGLMGLLVSGIIQSADTVGRGGLGTPAQEAQRAAQAAVEQLKGRTAQTEYRATEPQNVELPTVPLIDLSVKTYADENGVVPSTGNLLRDGAISRAKTRLKLRKGENSAAYIPASNVLRNGEEYVLKITKASLNKMLNPADGSNPSVESVVVVDNLERIANNGVWVHSRGDRKHRDQIPGFDYLKTTVYIDGVPYEVNMRVKLVQPSVDSDVSNVLYYFTPDEAISVKKAGTSEPAAGRRASSMSPGEVPTSNANVPQRAPGVKKQSMQESPAVFVDSDLSRRMAEAETEYSAAIEQAEAGGEYRLAEALYKEKLRVQDALTEQEIHRLKNELEQYQRQRQTGQKQTADATKAPIAKYKEVCYHNDGTVVVTDDWTRYNHPRVPMQYNPNAVVDTLSQKGEQHDRTFFDEKGQLIRQVNNGPHGNKKRHPYGKNGEHAHDIIWEGGKIIGRPTRELTDAERKENADIL